MRLTWHTFATYFVSGLYTFHIGSSENNFKLIEKLNLTLAFQIACCYNPLFFCRPNLFADTDVKVRQKVLARHLHGFYIDENKFIVQLF
jgi:hypothetical protein